MDYAKNFILRLNPVHYKFKDTLSQVRFGFVSPPALENKFENKEFEDPFGIDYHSLNYIDTIAPMIKIIIDLINRVELLEKIKKK